MLLQQLTRDGAQFLGMFPQVGYEPPLLLLAAILRQCVLGEFVGNQSGSRSFTRA
jgi:hypothetical protein